MKEVNPKAVSLFYHLPKEDYDLLASVCNVGLIFWTTILRFRIIRVGCFRT